MNANEQAAAMVCGLMRFDPSDRFRQGYSFANALNAVAEHPDFEEEMKRPINLATVAEFALSEIIRNIEWYPNATDAVKAIRA
jgi:hypothetical protein